MSSFRLDRPLVYDATARRVYVMRRRLHHGRVGAALFAAGIALMLHDRRDWPWEFARELLD